MVVPEFAMKRLRARRCRSCKTLFHSPMQSIRMAGIGITSAGHLGFEMWLRCGSCRGQTSIVIPPPLDWEEIGRWMAALVSAGRAADEKSLPTGQTAVGVSDATRAIRMKPVTVLDVTPGRADDRDAGKKIAMLTLGYMGEVEMPLMISQRDCRMLAKSMLAILAHHGDERAAFMFRQWNEEDQSLGT